MSRPAVQAVLAGNPNCGKSSLFNGLTGSRQFVGNWPGVTVERKEGRFALGEVEVTVADLPGVYSFDVRSEDESVTCRLLNQGGFDVIVNVVDATSLERGLLFTYQLLELGKPMLVVLTMTDNAERRGVKVDTAALERRLGVKVLALVGREMTGIPALKQAIAETARKAAAGTLPAVRLYPLPDALDQWLTAHPGVGRRQALALIEGHPEHLAPNPQTADGRPLGSDLPEAAELARLFPASDFSWLGSDARFEAVQNLLDQVVKSPDRAETFSDRVDRLVLHKALGVPLFFVVMFFVFWGSIQFGGAFQDVFEQLTGAVFVDGLHHLLESWNSPAWLTTILAHGLGSGLQTVASFIPVIFLLFFLLTFLEDSGYMARAAFVMDRLMRRIGLPGKAFVPLLVGFGCTIPAILSTRTFDQKRDRLLTVFMAPFMSCGARLPVYALFAAAFFGNLAGAAVFSFYLIGILAAVLTGFLLKSTLLPGRPAALLMELPAWHRPQLFSLFLHSWNRLRGFLVRAGTTITIMVAVLAGIQNIGWKDQGLTWNATPQESFLFQGGRLITPVLGPMGITADNPTAGVALVTGLFAKEAVIGTTNTLLSLQEGAAAAAQDWDFGTAVMTALVTVPENLAGIGATLLDPLGLSVMNEAPTGVSAILSRYFTPAAAYAFLLFVLLYFPCASAFGTAVKEVGAFWSWLMGIYATVLAWLAATVFYQIAEGHQWAWLGVALGMAGVIWLAFHWAGKKLPVWRPA